MSKSNILIVGLGNIGKRHLESFINLNRNLVIYCVDIKFSEKKIKINNKDILYTNSLKDFKRVFDVCVISTNSEERFSILKKVVKKNLCKKIILEKVTFSNLAQYKEAQKLSNSKTKIYINCPRRSWLSYRNLKKNIRNENLKLIEIQGYNWGILSNMIHFLDLFSYLSNVKKIELIYDDCNKIFSSSKRNGYYEVFGSFIFKNSFMTLLIVNDNKFFNKNSVIRIETNKNIYEINEKLEEIKKKNINSRSIKISKFQTFLQSNISSDYLKKINLVDLNGSLSSHKVLFECYNKVFPNKKKYPIT